jgi:CHRD domain-containing protein/PEP-CTERM motif-containing protein
MRKPRLRAALCGSLGLAVLVLAAPMFAATLFTTTLTGAKERPTPVNTAATGTSNLLLNDSETQIQLTLSWQNLTTNAILAHIHGPADANSTASPVIDLTSLLPAVPNTSGSLTTNPSTFNVTPTQVAQLKAGLWYINVHSVNFPNGEIRGQFVPEPGTALLLAVGLGGIAAVGRRRRDA